MTALAMDVRELSIDEVDSIAGGPIWVGVAIGVVVVVGLGAIAVGYMGAHNKAESSANSSGE
jgi:hypothetical protein